MGNGEDEYWQRIRDLYRDLYPTTSDTSGSTRGKPKKAKSKLLERRFPQILADKVMFALDSLRGELTPDQVADMLTRFRRNRTRAIAASGVNNIWAPVGEKESIPLELFQRIASLDEAFTELRNYPANADHYVARHAQSVVNSDRRSKVSDDEVYEVLKGYDALEHGLKGDRMNAAVKSLGVAKRSIEKALKRLRDKHRVI